MTVTSSQAMDELFQSFQKKALRKAQETGANPRAAQTVAAWHGFVRSTLQRQLDAFDEHVSQGNGEASAATDVDGSVIVNVFRLFQARLAAGISLTFRVHPKEGSISAETASAGKQLRFEAVTPAEATEAWVIRWFEMLLTDFTEKAL
jgi:hypothetical protein